MEGHYFWLPFLSRRKNLIALTPVFFEDEDEEDYEND